MSVDNPTHFSLQKMSEKKPKILVILGPTSTGKSDLGVEIALHSSGEVVSADSRQVYKDLDIATGKITNDEMKGVPHHLLSFADPNFSFTVSDFKKLAEDVIADILERNKLPILVGGTGFYIEAIIDDVVYPEVPPNEAFRKELEKFETDDLFQRLKNINQEVAEKMDSKNRRRIIRALEIIKRKGVVPPLVKKEKYNALQIGLDLPDEALKLAITERTKNRLKIGMVEEAEVLHRKGLTYKRMEQLGMEYRILSQFLQGQLNRDELEAKINMENWHYAKRQRTWFKKDQRIKWFNPKDQKDILQTIDEFLNNE